MLVHIGGRGEADEEENQHQVTQAQDDVDRAGVSGVDPLDAFFDEAEEAARLVLFSQEEGGERRSQSQRVKGGDGNRKGDGEGELAIEDSGGAGEEGDGNKDGNQDEGGGDDGAGDFTHGCRGGVMGIVVALAQMALDIFDDDDSVVDDESGGEGDAEESERVDGESEDLDEGEGADQRDGDGDSGNDGSAPVLEEEEDDDDDDDDGFAEGLDDLVDGVVYHGGGVDGDGVFQAGGKGFREFKKRGTALLSNIKCVGVGELEDADTDGLVAAVVEVGAVGFGAYLGATDVFEEDEIAVRILDDDALEFGGFRETTFDADDDLIILLAIAWRLA